MVSPARTNPLYFDTAGAEMVPARSDSQRGSQRKSRIRTRSELRGGWVGWTTPRRQPRQPARHALLVERILGRMAPCQRRLFVKQNEEMNGEGADKEFGQQVAAAEEKHFSAKRGEDAEIHRIAHVAIEPGHHEALGRHGGHQRSPA